MVAFRCTHENRFHESVSEYGEVQMLQNPVYGEDNDNGSYSAIKGDLKYKLLFGSKSQLQGKSKNI